MRIPSAPAVALLLVALLLCVPAFAARTLGLVVTAKEPTPALLRARFVDTVMEALAAGREWESTLLTADAALVRISDAPWPATLDAPLAAHAADLQRLVVAVRLDDLVAVRLDIAQESKAEVVWVRPDAAEARGFTLSQASPAEAGVIALARDMAAKLAEGFGQAPALAPVAPSTTVEVPSEPSAPTPPTEQPAPETPTAQPLSAHFAAAERFLLEGDLRSAEDSALRALNAGDPRGPTCLLMARIMAARRDDDGQRLWLERALAADPALNEARLPLAELLRQRGLWQKALAEFQRVLSTDPRNRFALLGMASIYAEHDQPRRAAEIVNEAIGYYPDDPSLYLRLGEFHAAYRAYPEAEAAFDRAARLAASAEEKARALDCLGDLYAQAGRHREGFACYAEASKLRAGSSGPLAERRYEAVMATADAALLRALHQATGAFDSYLADAGTAREEAYMALADLRGQAQAIREFMDTVVPPAPQRLMHARRKLGYSLILEAAVSAMVHLDTGRAELLQQYTARLREAEDALGVSGEAS